MPELYGSAVLATLATDDLTVIGSSDGFAGFPLGHNPDDRTHGLVFSFAHQQGHGMFFGATRAGKFVNILAPALLTCNANAVVTDPKGQAAWETGPRREAMGFRCVYLDPWGEIQRRYGDSAGVQVPVSRFNPLSALDPASETFNDDVSTIADALIVVGPGQDSHWTDSARELIAGLIAAVVELNPGLATLRDVRDLITATDEELVEKIVKIRARNPRSLAGRKLRRFSPRPNEKGEYVISEEIGSIRSTAETQTAILDSEALLTAMETDDPPFDLADLILDKVTLYLVLPPDRLNTHGRWLRMILTLAIRTISRVGKSVQESPCCFWLDEFSSLGNLRMIEDSYGLMAGLGVRIFAFLQDLSQLQRDYPHSWETFISNSSLVMLLQCADKTTAEYFSDRLGTMTINARTGGWSYKQTRWAPDGSNEEFFRLLDQQAKQIYDQGGPWPQQTEYEREAWKKNPSLRMTAASLKAFEDLAGIGKTPFYRTEWIPDEQLASRPIMLPQEIRDADRSKSIIIMPGVGNIQLSRWQYYSDPVLSPLARHDPNRPAPAVVTPPAPSVDPGVAAKAAPPPAAAPEQKAPQPPVAGTAPPPPYTPVNDNRPKPSPSVTEELTGLGKDAAKQAAGAAVSFLKSRLNR